ncbi:hypothetical protein [Thalassovita taeanensis]|uniref:hypothetical protein n=1 Tax=Thalassovita taeanensis TaxID=657014 RepID=UPI001114C5A7|nr:hypothetical protein [Thalassovita taeanensis]
MRGTIPLAAQQPSLRGNITTTETSVWSTARAFFNAPPEGFGDAPLLQPRGNLVVAGAVRRDILEQAFEMAHDDAPEARRVSVDEAAIRVPFRRRDYVGSAFYDPTWVDAGSLVTSTSTNVAVAHEVPPVS